MDKQLVDGQFDVDKELSLLDGNISQDHQVNHFDNSKMSGMSSNIPLKP
jgi:hypothetical protein